MNRNTVGVRRQGATYAPVAFAVGLAALFALALLAVQAIAPLSASAHTGNARSDGRIPGQPDFKRVGKTTYRFVPTKKVYEVSQPGEPPSYVHNDDFSEEKPTLANGWVGPGSWIEMPANRLNPPLCRTSGHRIVVVWAHTAGQPGAGEFIHAWLPNLVERMNWKFANQSYLLNPRQMVMDCNGSGAINVYDVTSASKNYWDVFAAVEQQLGTPTGANAVKYLVWDYDYNQNPPGISQLRSDTTKSQMNANAYFSSVSLIYADADETYTTVHELLHGMGGSQPESPYATNGNHCVDGVDILCYEDYSGSPWGPYTESRCNLSQMDDPAFWLPIDCGKDTYFADGPSAGSWLDTHWNVAGTENPFLVAAPSTVTKPPTALKTTSATLQGLVTSGGAPATYRFEYGLTTGYGTSVPVPSAPLPAESVWNGKPLAVSQPISGLKAGTTYHYRLAATDEFGQTSFSWFDETFTTPPLPSVSTNPATEVTLESATLNGAVNPNGTATTYKFEYGTTTGYGNSIPVPAASLGSGTESISVSQKIAKLKPDTEYHFRVVASNAEGTSNGSDMAFKTPVPLPTATTEAATSITPLEATLNGTVNPKGFKTTYQFEYGKTTFYGKLVPVPAKEVGSGTEGVKVSEKLSLAAQKASLEPNTTYHFRVVATNAGGTTKGEDLTFTTPRAVNPPAFSLSFGELGEGDGQFNLPADVAVDSTGNAWVLDPTSARVQKFNSEGKYQSKFGSKGKADGQFWNPRAITVDSTGNIWVADMTNARVEKFNSKGEFLLKFGKEGLGDGEFKAPRGITIDPEGNIWVADGLSSRRIEKFNSKGEFLLKAGKSGSGDGEFTEMGGIASDANGNVWVADPTKNRIQKFSPKGEYLGKFGEAGSGNGQFSGASDIAIDSAGTLWVNDGNGRVQAIYPEGEYVTKFGEAGSGKGQFKTLFTGIDIDPEGNFWVVDQGNNRVQKWAPATPYPVTTTTATAIGRTTATLNAKVNPQGKATSYQFEYGTSQAFGNVAPASPKSIGSGSTAVKVSEALAGLKASTTYYYHVAATSEAGTTYGETRRFTTLAPAGAEAKWRLGGKTLAEAGLEKATFASSGTMTIEIPKLQATFSKCTETTTGGEVSGTSGAKETITLTGCKLLELEEQCTVQPVYLPTVSGSVSSLTGKSNFTIETTGAACPWFKKIEMPAPSFSLEVGSEGKDLPVNTSGKTLFGTNEVFFTGVSTWWLIGESSGKTLGYW
jgi:sugar lactone lactonase YvrE